MAWLTNQELQRLSFRHLGQSVRISNRAAIHDASEMEIGDNSRIDDFCVVSGKVRIGRNVHLAVFCNVAGGTEGVEFADFSGAAYGCQIFSQSDDYSGQTLTNPTVPLEFKSETRSRVAIGRHCILGAGSIVLPGVNMADGCALGAMSLLRESTEPWSIYAGIPAKRIRERKRDLLILEQKYLDSSAQVHQHQRNSD
jgi:acetyltransferase-like isoleucine patch superfamily enzyme